MIVHRHVPLFAPMAAANEATDRDAPHGSDAFHKWFLDTQVPHGVTAYGHDRSLLHTLSLPVEVLLDEVLPNVPDTPVGRAWAACVRECIRLTEADALRPFDYISYDTREEQDALRAVEDYAEIIEDTSPLLGDVADAVSRMTLVSRFSPRVEFAAMARERSRLTDEGLVLGDFDEGFCDEDQSYCYHLKNARLIPWTHIEALMPGFEATLRSLLAEVDADLPEMVESDGAAARGRDLATIRATATS